MGGEMGGEHVLLQAPGMLPAFESLQLSLCPIIDIWSFKGFLERNSLEVIAQWAAHLGENWQASI